jgi:hypothetical protein
MFISDSSLYNDHRVALDDPYPIRGQLNFGPNIRVEAAKTGKLIVFCCAPVAHCF